MRLQISYYSYLSAEEGTPNTLFSAFVSRAENKELIGERIVCSYPFPKIARYTPLVAEGEFKENVFSASRIVFDSDRDMVQEFLVKTKVLTPAKASYFMDAVKKSVWDGLVASDILSEKLSKEEMELAVMLFQGVRYSYKTDHNLFVCGIPYAKINLLRSIYKQNLTDMIASYPYSCAFEAGFNMTEADSLVLYAERENTSLLRHHELSEDRIEFIIKKTAETLKANGYTSATADDLFAILKNPRLSCGRFSPVDPGYLFSCLLCSAVFVPEIMDDGVVFHVNECYEMEKKIAEEMARICSRTPNSYSFDLASCELDENQKNTVQSIFDQNNIHIITGGPGTGKTTVVKKIIELAEKRYSVAVCAPTGRAAAKIKEISTFPATTLHRMLKTRVFGSNMVSAGYNRENPLPYNFYIIDESSMLGLDILPMFLEAVREGSKIIFVGDANQLPSVSPGKIFSDIIHSGLFPVHAFSKVYRQSSGSVIPENAGKIISGETDFSTNESFSVFEFDNAEKLKEAVRDEFNKHYDNADPFSFQILTVCKNGEIGKNPLNKFVTGKDVVNFNTGDKVMTTVNNYSEICSYMNGDVGIVDGINEDGMFIKSPISELYVTNMKHVDLAYAMTVHKSQGSEYDHVLVVVNDDYPSLLYKNLIYTAVTRAKKSVKIFSVKGSFTYACRKDMPERRSGLKELLQSLFNALHPTMT